ncbi:MAG: hypothetical protein K2H67_05615, partial [Treponemataceae bacterium]|nr:hypothetical protein [Treponemataceae bacterium]
YFASLSDKIARDKIPRGIFLARNFVASNFVGKRSEIHRKNFYESRRACLEKFSFEAARIAAKFIG